MPVDLEMLLSAAPPLFAYSAFVDRRYTCYATDEISSSSNYDHGYTVEKNFLTDNHLQYTEISSSFDGRRRYPCHAEKDAESQLCNYMHSDKPREKKKRVSFADDKGLDLVQVRSIPIATGDTPKWTRNFFSFLTGETKDDNEETEKKWKLSFTNPTCNPSDFEERLGTSCLLLEEAFVQEGDVEDIVSGKVMVQNSAFEKEVFLRISYDRWVSYEDIPAVYMEPSILENRNDSTFFARDCDTFNFSATIPQSALRYEVVEFCFYCRMNSLEYWDNNGGVNYRLVATPTGKTFKTSRQVSQILTNCQESVSTRFRPITEPFSTSLDIDAWEKLWKERPYW